jgi:hypothetical protein
VTAILAAPAAGRVIVGADRAWSDTDAGTIYTCGPKVLRVGDWLIGCAGVYGGDWEALASIDPPDAPSDWSHILPPHEDSSVVLVRGKTIRLGEVHKGYWCWGETRGACAIGSGGSEVHAAWLAMRGYETDHEKRMRAALAASARVNVTVRGPFDVFWS